MMKNLRFVEQGVEGFFGRQLFGATDGAIQSIGIGFPVDEHLHVVLLFIPCASLVNDFIHQVFLVLLRPFEQLALEVDVGVLQFLQVNVDLDMRSMIIFLVKSKPRSR